MAHWLPSSLLCASLWTTASLWASAASLATLAGSATAQTQVVAAAESSASRTLWSSAREGSWDKFHTALTEIAGQDPAADGLAKSALSLRNNIELREAERLRRQGEVREQFTKALEGEQTDIGLAKALRAAIELQLLAADREALLAEPDIKAVIQNAEQAARDAETRADLLTSFELFSLLNTMMEESAVYKADARRLSQRLEMIRLYVPETLWKLRNDRQNAAGDTPLPPYNKFGDDYEVKLATIDQTLLRRAFARARLHVEQRQLNEVLLGGLEAVRTMVTTDYLRQAFPTLAEESPRTEFITTLDTEIARVKAFDRPVDDGQIEIIIDRVRRANEQTVRIPTPALLHELGNGAMGHLDEFSGIIWPDEVRRFNKMTQSSFVGVGIQIEYDELSSVRVVTPLEGTPAQRAGIHPGDVIKRVDGRDIFGLTLDQAVDVITGPEGTNVTLTIERKTEAPAAEDGPQKEEKDFVLRRSIINVPTVKGWKRNGDREDDWEWFVDAQRGIGYVRLTQFSENSSRELDAAVRAMQRTGLNAMILDLRFNPGGLLDQAVKITRRFIKTSGGFVVMMQGPGGMISSPEYTIPSQARLADIPIVVLINEGSASASEIVSGALKAYAKDGPLNGDLDVVVVGGRSFGKGSVQNVWDITSNAKVKVTTQYYMLPDRSIIHRRPGAPVWGVEPDLKVEMLPKQTADALLLRRNADVLALNEGGRTQADFIKEANPDDLIAKGLDLQLEAALVMLQSKVETMRAAQATPAR
jgi:carboxyl-terminal processing protease